MKEKPRNRVDLVLDDETARMLAVLADKFYKNKTEAVAEAITALYLDAQPVKKAVLKLYNDISDAIQAIEAYRDYQAENLFSNDDVEALIMLNKFWDQIRTLELFEEPNIND